MVEHLKDFPSNVVVAVDRPEGAAMKPFLKRLGHVSEWLPRTTDE